MSNYHIVAFYRESETEVSKHAEVISRLFHLQLRYETVPRLPETIAALVGTDTVLCLLDRTAFRFRRLMKYVYALNRPVIVVQPKSTTI